MKTTQFYLRRLISILMLFSLSTSLSYAAETQFKNPFKDMGPTESLGLWQQVEVVAMNPTLDITSPWFTDKQYFWFFANGDLKHLAIEFSSNSQQEGISAFHKSMMENTPAIQKIKWIKTGSAWLKHPERPAVHIGVVLCTQSVSQAGKTIALKGDMLVVFHEYKNPNKPLYYRVLRKVGDE